MAAGRELNLALLFTFLLLSPSYVCHYLPKPEEIIQGVFTNGKHSLKRRSTEQSLRIKVDTQSSSIAKLKSNKRKLIVDRLLPEAIAYFAKTLRVRRASMPLRLQRKCESGSFVMKQINGGLFRFCIGECDVTTYCGLVQVPASHLDVCRTCNSAQTRCLNESVATTGVRNADFVLYISAVSTSHCKTPDVLAYAASCQLEQSLDRPVAGFVNFCQEELSDSIHYTHLLAILKHEIFHALGFSASLYGYYRADDGTPLTPRRPNGRPENITGSDKVVKNVVREHWKVSDTAGSSIAHPVTMIVTARVLKEARLHFNCPTLEGAEIENQGLSGQRLSHWEKRLFENEAMTGVFTNNPVFSRITLALMEDTGWYKANYEMAEDLDWGKNAGCLFAQNSCKAWMDYKLKKSESILPFCGQIAPEDHTRTVCTHDYEAVGTCNIAKYKSRLPADYRYFNRLPGADDAGYYGGATALADYCPYIQELNWKKNGTTIRGSSCKHVSNSLSFEQNYALEEYGGSSSCFLHGQVWTRKSCTQSVTAADWGSGCYSYTCTERGIVVSILDHSYPCSFMGEVVHVELLDKKSWLHKGSFICPPCRKLCADSCPFVETKSLYNSTSHERTAQQVLVCSSLGIHPSFRLVVFLYFFFMHVFKI